MTLEEKMDACLAVLRRVELQNKLHYRALQLIFQELGIRKELHEIAKEMEETNGSDAPPAMGSERR